MRGERTGGMNEQVGWVKGPGRVRESVKIFFRWWCRVLNSLEEICVLKVP